MKVGALIPNSGPAPGDVGVGTMAVEAERAGAESLWVSDHLLLVDEETRDYPYSDDGAPTWAVDVDYYEALITLTHMAAVTTAPRIGTAVMVLPQRNVLEVAKMAATIDRLSGGRLALGLGAGWNRLEFEALGQRFETRGRRFDEMLRVLRDCWSGRPAAFEGEEVRVPSGVVLMPRPRDEGGPPLLVGGMTARARRRAAELGDGWLAITWVDRWDAGDLKAKLDDTLARRSSPDPRDFERILLLHAAPSEVDALPELAAECQRIGFSEVIVEVPWLEGIERACSVLAACRGAVASG